MRNLKNTIILILPILLATNCTNKDSITTLENASPVDDIIYEKVDQIPEFTGGMENFMGYLQHNLNYPEIAKKNGTEGKVFVEFVVNKDGTISHVKVIKGIGSGCDEEAAKVIRNSPSWRPGVKDGRAVNTKLVLPISFKLS